MKTNPWLLCLIISFTMDGALAQVKPDDFVGNWMTSQRDGIVQLSRCALYKDAPPTALCGVVIWDINASHPSQNTPLDCNRKVFEAIKFDNGAWKGGWAFDTRSRKFHSATLRLKDDNLHVRTYVGNEVNGVTEVFTRVDEAPNDCGQRAPETISVKGVGR